MLLATTQHTAHSVAEVPAGDCWVFECDSLTQKEAIFGGNKEFNDSSCQKSKKKETVLDQRIISINVST